MNANGRNADERQYRQRQRFTVEAILCLHMNSDGLLMRDEVYQVVGAAIECLNELGHGWHEKPFENALVVEFKARSIPFVQQPRFPLTYKTVNVGEYVPDLIAFNSIVIDAKVIDAITDHERGQMLNYLRITECKVGVILNFKRAKLEWERIVLSCPSRPHTLDFRL